MSPLLFAALKPVTLTPTELRWDLLNVGVGVLLLVIGLTATALFFFRPKWRDRSLIYFGVFTMLYAVRLLANRLLIESVVDVSRIFWLYFDYFISSTIILPFGLYLYELVESELKPFFLWIVGAQAVCAIGEIVGCDLRRWPSQAQSGQQHRDHPERDGRSGMDAPQARTTTVHT